MCIAANRLMKKRIPLNCANCSIRFEPRFVNKKTRFCSRRCTSLYTYRVLGSGVKNATRNTPPQIELTCSHCKAKFFRVRSCVNKNSKSGLQFCSRVCSDKGKIHVKPRTKRFTCRQCKKTSEISISDKKTTFCSKECKGLAKRRTKPFTCRHCKETFEISTRTNRTKYCSRACQGLAKRSSTYTRKRSTHLIKVWSKAVLERDGNKCVRCECDDLNLLQAHHKLSFAEHPKLRYEVNNGETLCLDCHSEEHPKMATLIKSHRKSRGKCREARP